MASNGRSSSESREEREGFQALDIPLTVKYPFPVGVVRPKWSLEDDCKHRVGKSDEGVVETSRVTAAAS